jgi:hypothetical protein
VLFHGRDREIFNKRVSEFFNRALGTTVEKFVYQTLEEEFKVSRDNLASNPEALTKVLSKVFGASGGEFLTRSISSELAKEFNLLQESASDEKTLSEILRQAREKCSSSN